MNEKKALLEMLSPKQALIFGGVIAFFVLSTLGFFILGANVLFSGNSNTGGNNVVVKQDENKGFVPPTNNGIDLVEVTDDDWYKGNKDAKITIVEFSDPECPFCKRFHNTMNQIIAKYGDDVKWVYRHAPLDSLHRKARREANATECAGDQKGNEGFWKYIDLLMERTPSNDRLEDSELFAIADEMGLNKKEFTKCVESDKFGSNVQADLDDGQRAGLRGTPHSILVVGDEKTPISGAQPYAQVEQLIQSYLNK